MEKTTLSVAELSMQMRGPRKAPAFWGEEERWSDMGVVTLDHSQ